MFTKKLKTFSGSVFFGLFLVVEPNNKFVILVRILTIKARGHDSFMILYEVCEKKKCYEWSVALLVGCDIYLLCLFYFCWMMLVISILFEKAFLFPSFLPVTCMNKLATYLVCRHLHVNIQKILINYKKVFSYLGHCIE